MTLLKQGKRTSLCSCQVRVKVQALVLPHTEPHGGKDFSLLLGRGGAQLSCDNSARILVGGDGCLIAALFISSPETAWT